MQISCSKKLNGAGVHSVAGVPPLIGVLPLAGVPADVGILP